MSRPDAPTRRREDLVWAASRYESRLHLVSASQADSDEDAAEGRCTHRVRHVVGAWTALPNIDGYVPCEPCCVAAGALGMLTGPAVSLDEALRLPTAVSRRYGQHSMDRPTQLIPTVEDVDTPTVILPRSGTAFDTEPNWPETDPDDGESTSGDEVPGSEDERSWQSLPARLARRSLPGTIGDRTRQPAPGYRPRHALREAA